VTHLKVLGGGLRRMAGDSHRVSRPNSHRPHQRHLFNTKFHRCRRSTGPIPLHAASKEWPFLRWSASHAVAW